MKIFLSILATAILSSQAVAEPLTHCDQMVAFGYPSETVRSNTTPLCRISYFVSHNNSKKVPVYAAEYLIKENLGGKTKRVNAFKPDPDLDEQHRAELSDYDGNTQFDRSFDRGHMAPFEDARIKSAAALQTFYLSNMIPQQLHMNRGVWRSIENRTRGFALRSTNGVYVITGPVFQGKTRTIGKGVAVPTMVYKVIIDKDAMQGMAYLVPNRKPLKGEKPEKFIVTIAEVEKLTGINFTPQLLDAPFKRTIGAKFK